MDDEPNALDRKLIPPGVRIEIPLLATPPVSQENPDNPHCFRIVFTLPEVGDFQRFAGMGMVKIE